MSFERQAATMRSAIFFLSLFLLNACATEEPRIALAQPVPTEVIQPNAKHEADAKQVIVPGSKNILEAQPSSDAESWTAHIIRRKSADYQISGLTIGSTVVPVVIAPAGGELSPTIAIAGHFDNKDGSQLFFRDQKTPVVVDKTTGDFVIHITLNDRVNQLNLTAVSPDGSKESERLYIYAPKATEFKTVSVWDHLLLANDPGTKYPSFMYRGYYVPGYFGFKQILASTGDQLNIAGLQLLNLGAQVRMTVSAAYYFEFEVNAMQLSVGNLNFDPYRVNSSSMIYDSYYIRGARCLFGKRLFERLCPSIEIGLDNYPILDFGNSNSDLSLSKVRDMVVGVGVDYERALSPRLDLVTVARYDYGLKSGQSSVLGVTSDSKWSARAGVRWPLKTGAAFTLLAAYENRTAAVRSSIDQWSSSVSQYSLRLGYTAAYGRK